MAPCSTSPPPPHHPHSSSALSPLRRRCSLRGPKFQPAHLHAPPHRLDGDNVLVGLVVDGAVHALSATVLMATALSSLAVVHVNSCGRKRLVVIP